MTTNPTDATDAIRQGLLADDPSVRLRAAMAVGVNPDPALTDTLVERAGVEPDFFVRDMIAWALLQLPTDLVLSRLETELGSSVPQARAQSLHTLSKIGDPGTWSWITDDMLTDIDDDVARTAWRVSAALAPPERRSAVAHTLAGQLGRGDRQLQLSLSRAMAELGDDAVPALEEIAASQRGPGSAHARATLQLIQDPSIDFAAAVNLALRMMAPGGDQGGDSLEDSDIPDERATVAG